MSEIVFILGAGASADAGAPVMNNFWDYAWNIYTHMKEEDNDYQYFRTCFKAIYAIDEFQAKSFLDSRNLETVFCALEMGKQLGRFGRLSSSEIEESITSLYRVIARTLEDSVLLHLPTMDDSQIEAPEHLNVFSKTIGRNLNRVSIITFNYDTALEYSLHKNGIKYDYCFESKTTDNSILPIYKLHGSLNWRTSRDGKLIDALNFSSESDVLVSYRPDNGGRFRKKKINFSRLLFTSSSDQKYVNYPLIIPPTWNKASYPIISNVWKNAAEELQNAQTLVFVGYSFPVTDTFFHYLLAIGLTGITRLKNIFIVDPNDQSALRYKSLAGSLTSNRVGHISLKFRDFTRSHILKEVFSS